MTSIRFHSNTWNVIPANVGIQIRLFFLNFSVGVGAASVCERSPPIDNNGELRMPAACCTLPYGIMNSNLDTRESGCDELRILIKKGAL